MMSCLRIATNNVLFEDYYCRHCHKSVPRMPYQQRVAAWGAMATSPMFKSQDIVLLQEWPAAAEDWNQFFVPAVRDSHYQSVHVPASVSPQQQDKHKMRIVCAKEKGDCAAVAFNPQTFEMFDTLPSERGKFDEEDCCKGKGGTNPAVAVHSFGRGKTAVRVLLRHKASGNVIACVSAHLRWSSKIAEQDQYLRELHQFATAQLRPDLPLFVGGDFNLEPRGGDSCGFPIFTSDAHGHTAVAPAGREDEEWVDLTPPRAVQWTQYSRTGPIQLDYIFARWPYLRSSMANATTGVVSSSVVDSVKSLKFPTNPLDLLPHDLVSDTVRQREELVKSSYYSDHAFLCAEIPLVSATPPAESCT